MMKDNKFKSTVSYFRYQFLNNGKALLFITIFSIIIAFIIGVNGQPRYDYHVYYTTVDKYVEAYNATLGFSVILLSLLCYFVPILLFSFFKQRRNLDYIYSMPISRRNVGIVHYVIGYIMVIVPFTAAYLTNFFLLLSRQSDTLDLLPCLPFYFWCLLLGWIMYSLFTFAFNEANTTGDGCVFMILWTFVFSLIAELFEFFNYKIYALIPWGFLGELTGKYSYLIEKRDSDYYNELFSEINVALGILVAVAIFAMVYLLLTFGKRRTEEAEEISNSPFGYRTLIPIYLITMTKILGDFTGEIFLTIAGAIAYTIYRRGFKYKVSDYIVMGLMLVVCVIELILSI